MCVCIQKEVITQMQLNNLLNQSEFCSLSLICFAFSAILFQVRGDRLSSQILSNKLLNWDTLVSTNRNPFGLIDLWEWTLYRHWKYRIVMTLCIRTARGDTEWCLQINWTINNIVLFFFLLGVYSWWVFC